MEKLRIIVSGFIGLYPTGGVTWDYIQYPLGLKALGHDVYYIEDTLQYSTFQSKGKAWNDSSDSINYLKTIMTEYGFSDRWAYRDIASGKCFGLTETQVLGIIKTADVFINVSEATYLRNEYLEIPKKVLIDSDPMFTQVQYWEDEAKSDSAVKIRDRYALYNYLFTFGENIGNPDCLVPTMQLNWIPTRQPICLNFWKSSIHKINECRFTTIMNWSTRNKLKYKGEEWGQKDVEFQKILNLPRHLKSGEFEIVVSSSSTSPEKFKKSQIEKYGWKTLEPENTIQSPKAYQNFIMNSTAEISVAKETYVKSNSGWFSCRSACYLAAGVPVVTQDTGWTKFLPHDNGLISFTDLKSAIEGLSKIKSNLSFHKSAAKEIAYSHFDSNKILTSLLNLLS